MDNSIYLAI